MRANGISRRNALLGVAGASFLPTIARAQEYPSRPVRVIVPFSAGGNTDIMARIIMPRVAEQLGQPFVVENRPSASTVVGTEAVAKAQPDGYTLLAVDTTLAVLPTLQPRLPFDIFRDLVPISTLVSAPTTLVVRASLPARSLQDVIALAKAQPGRLSYATGSIGGTAHLAALLFQEEAGISLLHAPYSGAGQAMTDLVGGHLDITFSALAAVSGLVEAGSVRAIATSGAERVPIAPDLPTFRESGLPNVVVSAHWGLYAPAGTPPRIVERLSAAAAAAVREPAIESELERRGYVIVGGSAADQARILREEHDKWGAVMRRTGSVPG
ncbi:Bug family tripartite tricarboxylate transporter substrate binding protein [Falsiroseomonas sp.]|uniref:Bug family tripartite tricarboxylate transporter substrate binding protein n=1 Tax=Falsiroseomonas sp. TaxID=2870721 RepID=UPI0035663BDC